jgi:UDP-glucose 4-epimerase
LVTGGAGFIGSHLADALVADRHAVTVVDDLSTGRREFVPGGAEFIEADIGTLKFVDIVQRVAPEVLYHLAAQISVSESARNPRGDAEMNICGSLNVLAAAQRAGVKRFVNVSSGAVYSPDAPLPYREPAALAPLSPYGVAKLAVEHYCQYFARFRGLPTVSLRLGNVFGPRQNPLGEAGVIAIFLQRMLSGEPVEVHGSGAQAKDYIHISDVVDAFLRLLEVELPAAENLTDRCFNIGTGKPRSVNEIFAVLADITNYRLAPVAGPARPADQKLVTLDCTRAQRKLNWKPEVGWEDGLRQTYEWFAANRGVFAI